MANEPQTKPVQPPASDIKKSDRVRVDLVNPTPARRVIYDGITGSMRAITIEPGETKRNVEISELIAKELRSRTRSRGKEKSDLLVYSASQAPDPSKSVPESDEDDEDDE